MKKEERLHRLLGDIDDGLVAEATRRPVRKTVWMPIVAAAACVALTVGLWQGGVFDPAEIPVEVPNEGTSTTTEGTKDTTTTTTEPYILVGGEEDSASLSTNSFPSTRHSYISPALKEKMNEYRDVNAVYQVLVGVTISGEELDEFDNYLKSNEEYQTLTKQYEDARKALKEANKREDDCEYPYDDPRKAALRQERQAAEKKKNELSHKKTKLKSELLDKFIDDLNQTRISYAAKYSKTELVSGCGPNGYLYYMELTADAINELYDRKGYSFKLTTEKGDSFVDW